MLKWLLPPLGLLFLDYPLDLLHLGPPVQNKNIKHYYGHNALVYVKQNPDFLSDWKYEKKKSDITLKAHYATLFS